LKDNSSALQGTGALDAELHARLHYLDRIHKVVTVVDRVNDYGYFSTPGMADSFETALAIALSDSQPFAPKLQYLRDLANASTAIDT